MSIRLICLVVFLTGCASKVDKFSYLKAWNDKWQQCDEIGKRTILDFPDSDWFDSLSLDDKREVFLYIHFLKDYECTRTEAVELRAVLNDADITTLNDILKGFVYFEEPSDADVRHLDKQQIRILADQIRQPFNPIPTAEKMGLVEH